MNPQLFHLYGPFYIQVYGLIIATGLATVLYALQLDTRLRKLISLEQFHSLVFLGFLGAVCGGRIWYVISAWDSIETWSQICMIHEGGLSILGAILGAFLSLFWYLHYSSISTFQVLDVIVIYVPLLQSISRLGCFFAGCCYGKASNLPWAITYTHQNSLAPLHVALHPSQLYSTATLFLIFCLIYWLSHQIKQKAIGQLTMIYFILASSERFILDFFRADQSIIHNSLLNSFSFDQWLACGIFGCSCISLLLISQRTFS